MFRKLQLGKLNQMKYKFHLMSQTFIHQYPSIKQLMYIILQHLSEDYEDLKTRTKLTLVDIQQLIELCVSECYFLWDNVIWNLLNSGPIGLSIMVVLSESYLQNLEKNAIELALRFDIAPKTFCRYVDDSHARFGSRSNATEFLNVLNSQDPQIQYTIEYENEHKELNVLGVTIKKTQTNIMILQYTINQQLLTFR